MYLGNDSGWPVADDDVCVRGWPALGLESDSLILFGPVADGSVGFVGI